MNPPLCLFAIAQNLQAVFQLVIQRRFNTHHFTGAWMSELQRCRMQEQTV